MRRATTILLYLATLSLAATAQGVECEQDHRAAGEVDNIVISDAGAIFAVTGAGLYRSIDKGESWQQVYDQFVYGPLELPNGDLLAAEYFDVLRSTAGAFRKNLFAVGALEGPSVSLDCGATWTLCAGVLDDALIHSPAVDEEGYLFAGTHSGLQRSSTPLALD